MAQIKLLPGLIKSLSGTVGDMTFRTINGKTYMHERHKPGLPEHPTRKQRAQYTKQVIVGECVGLIQKQMNDITDAILKRAAIKKKIEYWYDKFAPHIKARTKLQRAIMTAYSDPENGSNLIREILDNGSMKSEKENGHPNEKK